MTRPNLRSAFTSRNHPMYHREDLKPSPTPEQEVAYLRLADAITAPQNVRPPRER